MTHQKQITIRLFTFLCLRVFCHTSFGQNASDVKFFGSPADQLLYQIRMGISSYARKTIDSKNRWEMNFFSLKFIVNGVSHKLDSVLFSESADRELIKVISLLINEKEINWDHIIKRLIHNPVDKNYGLMVFVSVYRDGCPLNKLYPQSAWAVFNDLLFLGKPTEQQEIVILGSMEVNISTN
jgi:hypothetical protein